MTDLSLAQCGIYAIRNLISGRCYVGSSVQIPVRWRQHRKLLNRGEHHSPALQRSWVKHGAEAFVFEVLEEVARDGLHEAEQRWMDALNAACPRRGFNAAPLAGTTRGFKQTDATRAKYAEATRRYFEEHPEARERMREVGRKNGAAGKGRKMSAEVRAASSAMRKASPELQAVARTNAAKATAAVLAGAPRRKWTAEQRAELSRIRAADPRFSAALAKGRAAVKPENRAAGSKRTGDKLRGQPRHDRRQITFEQAEEIRALRADGMNYNDLHARFGIAKPQICAIIKMRIYLKP